MSRTDIDPLTDFQLRKTGDCQKILMQLKDICSKQLLKVCVFIFRRGLCNKHETIQKRVM